MFTTQRLMMGSAGFGETGGWDLASATYDSVSLGISTGDINATDLFFKPDGTELYVVGTPATVGIKQYTLNTPWLASSGSLTASLPVNAVDTSPTGMFIKPDGTTMFLLGNSGNDINQYTLSTAWLISSGTADGVTLSVSSQDGTPTGMAINSDGTRVFVLGAQNDSVFQYNLPTPWVLTGGSYSGLSLSVVGQDSSPTGIYLKPDGTKLYMIGSGSTPATIDRVYQYGLPTPDSLSGSSYDSIGISVNSQETASQGVSFRYDNGKKMYVIGTANNTVYQYSLD